MATVFFPRTAKLAAQALASVSQPLGAGGGVWLLTMNGQHTPDNRLTPEFIRDALLPALDHVELEWHRQSALLKDGKGSKDGALVLTGEQGTGKFFSNGLILECLKEYPTFFKDYYYKLLTRIMTFPLHTVSAINGHCFAGGLCLALATDWRICRPDRTWLSMNELNFGAPLPPGMAALLQARLPPPIVRDVMLTAHRYTAPEALKAGIVDMVVEADGTTACVERAVEYAKGVKGLAATGVLQAMKRTLYAPALLELQRHETLQVGGPQAEGKVRFEELLKAESLAKL